MRFHVFYLNRDVWSEGNLVAISCKEINHEEVTAISAIAIINIITTVITTNSSSNNSTTTNTNINILPTVEPTLLFGSPHHIWQSWRMIECEEQTSISEAQLCTTIKCMKKPGHNLLWRWLIVSPLQANKFLPQRKVADIGRNSLVSI